MYFEPRAGAVRDPAAVLTGCIENGADSVLMDADALPDEFFDLSTGFAGELLHKLTTYRIRLAAVVSDPSAYSTRFQEFVGEANRGRQCRFVATRREAIEWLESK